VKRRTFLKSSAATAALLPWESAAGNASLQPEEARIQLPTLPGAKPLPEVVLFAFDTWALPFQNHVELHLATGKNPRVVLRHGAKGAHDEALAYYGSVVRIGDTFHLWYNGLYGPLEGDVDSTKAPLCVCYATSRDGIVWEKPSLGLVEFNGSKKNNIVELQPPKPWSTFAVLHDPEDPNSNRRFKVVYEIKMGRQILFCVAFSPDGLRWKPSPRNPVGPFFEMAGITKCNGLYYVNGQADLRMHRKAKARRLTTFVSADFEHWSPCAALGLDRAPDLTSPSKEADDHQYEEIHLGAGLWNRGNVILGIYGQWHGHFSGDRSWLTMDLGFAITHDALHYHEPIAGFRLIPAREQPENPLGVMPALMQGQGMENIGDQTLYWYSTWGGWGIEGTGVRMVSWQRDRLGMLKPFNPANAQVISCPIQVVSGRPNVYVNASGLGEHSRLRVGLLDEGFRPISGYSGENAALLKEQGLRIPVFWKGGNSLPISKGLFRLDLRFDGVRPEDGALHAVYVSS
jgi:hypothetical protein